MRLHLPLNLQPTLVQVGLGQHGRLPRERFRMTGIYGVHFYHYRGVLEINGQRLPFTPGCISVTPPGADLVWHFPRHAPHHYAHLRFPSANARDMIEIPMLTTIADPRRREILFAEFEAAIAAHAHTPMRAAAWMWNLLWNLMPPPHDHSSRHPTAAGSIVGTGATLHPAIQTVLAVVEDALDQTQDLGTLAVRVGLSKTHLIRLFHRHCGTTVMGWIRQRRMEKARELLLGSSMPVQSIASAVGISDLQRFNKMVRKQWGSSPTALRNTSRT